jgi:hypothetical protein
MRFEHRVSLGTNSDGTLASAQILPRLASIAYVAPTYTAGTPTAYPITSWGASSALVQYATLNSNFDRFRIACWGVEVRSVGRLDATGGVVTVLTSTDDTGGALVDPNNFAFHNDTFAVVPGVICRWNSAPLGSDAHTFYPVSSTSTPEMYNWTYPVIFATGLSTDVVLEANIVMQVELLPKEGTVTAMLMDRGHLEKIVEAAGPVAARFGQKAVDVAMSAALGALSVRANRYLSGAISAKGAAPAA